MGTYHDFAQLGISGTSEFAPDNQIAKESIISYYLDLVDGDSVLELFGADGYYSMLALERGAASAVVVDNNHSGKWLDAGEEINRQLGYNINFINQDVHDYLATKPTADIVINCGGLYHTHDPLAVLQQSYKAANRWLIIQSVVSLEPNETFRLRGHGCRFSREWLDTHITKCGWDVRATDYNELPLNNNLEDKGSIYYLIWKERT